MRRRSAFLLLAAAMALCSARAAFEPKDTAGLERSIHERVNELRSKAGAGELAWDAQLAKIARRHSRDMAERNYFDHEDPDGLTAKDRAARDRLRIGREYEWIGENISRVNVVRSVRTTIDENGERKEVTCRTAEDLEHDVIAAWMGSRGHRENLLRPVFNAEGIGATLGRDGNVYVTQVLMKRLPNAAAESETEPENSGPPDD